MTLLYSLSHYLFLNWNLQVLGVSFYTVSYLLRILADKSFFTEKVFKLFGLLLITISVLLNLPLLFFAFSDKVSQK